MIIVHGRSLLVGPVNRQFPVGLAEGSCERVKSTKHACQKLNGFYGFVNPLSSACLELLSCTHDSS